MDSDTETPETDDYYAWLGLGKEASADDIRNAYRKLSRIYHPDKHAQSPEKASKAGQLFTKIKRAHEVLSDPNKKAIYDTIGIKGLETEGWEIIARSKTPRETLEEYERLQQFREEQLLRTLTNPKGSFGMSIDATEVFDRYTDDEDDEFTFPSILLTGMSLAQSVEARLTPRDIVELSAAMGIHEGSSSGTFTTSYRRSSYKSWAEVEMTLGSEQELAVLGSRHLFGKTYLIMSGSVQFVRRKRRKFSGGSAWPLRRYSLSTVLGTQLGKGLIGKLVWNAGAKSSMKTVVSWTHNGHFVNAFLQIGVSNTFALLRYSYTFEEHEFTVKTCVRAGPLGVTFEYGCDKQITRFSNVGATMVIGNAVGVLLRIRLSRGKQIYATRISLSDELSPAAIFYGTVVPVVAYFVIKKILVVPFMWDQREKEKKARQEANAQKMAKNKMDAEAAVELMTETVDRNVAAEEKKGGLVIRKALYGKLVKDNEDISEAECISVSKPLQALVINSELRLVGKTPFSELPGFYDPCIGEDKELSIEYDFRRKRHFCRVPDNSTLHLPARAHVCDTRPSDASTTSASGDGARVNGSTTHASDSSPR